MIASIIISIGYTSSVRQFPRSAHAALIATISTAIAALLAGLFVVSSGAASESRGPAQEAVVDVTPATSESSVSAIPIEKRSGLIIISKEFARAYSPEAYDLKGIEPSLYRGKFFKKNDEDFRKCVIQRESRGRYNITGGGNLDSDPWGDYSGAYQLHPDLAHGVVFMMAKESKKTEDGLLSDIRDLHDIKPKQWSRYFQDRAFYTILNWEGSRSGQRHWYLSGSSCNSK